MRSRQISRGRQELVDNLSPSKNKGPLEQLHPVLQCLRVMPIQPSFEGSILTAQHLDAPGIFNSCVYFQTISYYARVGQ